MSIIRTEKRERTFAGKLIKWTFLGFNLFMTIWIAGGLYTVSKIPMHSAAEKLGAGIGTTIGVTVLLVLWASGDLILGILLLVTRGNKVTIEESSTSFGGQEPISVNFSRVDERIAQLKAEIASPPTPALGTAQGPASFGRRRA